MAHNIANTLLQEHRSSRDHISTLSSATSFRPIMASLSSNRLASTLTSSLSKYPETGSHLDSKKHLQTYNKDRLAGTAKKSLEESSDRISQRMNEIRQKYSSAKKNQSDVPVHRSRPKQIITTNNTSTVDNKPTMLRGSETPISLLHKKSLQVVQDIKISESIQCKAPAKSNHSAASFDITDAAPDPRIESIDKINEKIRNILKNISKEHIVETQYTKSHTPNDQTLVLKDEVFRRHRRNETVSHVSQEAKVAGQRWSFGVDHSKYDKGVLAGISSKYQQLTKNKGSVVNTEVKSQPEDSTSTSNSLSKQRTLNLTSVSSKYLSKPLNYNPHIPGLSTTPKISTAAPENKILSNLNSIVNVESTESIRPKKTMLTTILSEESIVMTKPLLLQETVLVQKTESIRLISSLKQQVCLDENLRNKKYAFKEIRNQPNKEEQLLNTFAALNMTMDRETILNEINITESEYNPFYTFRDDADVSSIAAAYKEAKDHWENSILKKFDGRKLKTEGLKEEMLRFSKKDYLTMEDFVRLLNNEADSLFRNRDLVLIFRRLKKDSKDERLSFEEFVEQISISSEHSV